MSGLLLRYSPREGFIRSVGDPPNGILGVATNNGTAYLTIDPSYMTKLDSTPGAKTEWCPGSDNEQAIELADAIDACADLDTHQALIATVRMMIYASAAHAMGRRDGTFGLTVIQSYVDLAHELERLLGERHA